VSRATRPRDHEEFDQLAVGWALHALEPEDEAVFVRHLPGCPRCARTVADTEGVMAALATDLPPAEPSEGLRSRLRAAVEQTEQVRRPDVAPPVEPQPGNSVPTDRVAPPVPVPPGPRTAGPPEPVPIGVLSPLRRRGPALALAAALAGVVGLGVWNVSLVTARDRAEAVAAQQSAVVEELLRPGAQVVAQLTGDTGTVATVVRQDGDLQVVSQGLSVNDDTRETYVLWGVQDQTPVALGTFDVARSRLDVHAVGSTLAGSGTFDAYAVSLEPGRQPPATPSEVLASGQVTS
jgi:hypothetical protein